MLIEQIFELREPGPLGRICTRITEQKRSLFFCCSKNKHQITKNAQWQYNSKIGNGQLRRDRGLQVKQ